MTWDLISFVVSSKTRFKVLTLLNRKKLTPTDLKKILKTQISAVSRTLSELSDKELIICLTDTRKKSKYYYISDKGKQILNEIKEMTDETVN